MADADARGANMNPRIYVLALNTFAYGSAAFIFTGLLEAMAADLGVSTGVAGQLQTAYILTAALLGPVAAWWFGSLDRRWMVVGGLAASVLLHLACAVTPNFQALLALRGLAGLAGAISGTAASVAAAALAPPDRRGSAMALVTGGLTVAFVLGIPLGSVVGSLFGWRATFVFAGLLSSVALVATVIFLPAIPAPPTRQGGRAPVSALWPLYLTTFLLFAVNMTLTLYIAPIVRVGAGVVGAGVGVFQSMIGWGSIAGLWLGAKAADRNVGKSWILMGFGFQAAAMSLHFAATHQALPAGLPSQLVVALAIFVAALAVFSISPVIQSRLIQATHGAPVALALNGSVVSLGQALGSVAGGASLAAWGVPAIPATALALSLTAFLILSVAFPRAKAGS